jgi:hypothetical protein
MLNREEHESPQPPSNLSGRSGTNASGSSGPFADPVRRSCKVLQAGVLIINADDWGRDHETTERISECIVCRSVSSVSAMVFMEDSERAAVIAGERRIDAGLHLNLTTPFSATSCSAKLNERQSELAGFLGRHPFARVAFHPGLARSFEYVVAAQIDEFRRLYQKDPDRLDGHHHMHLCANVLFGGLLPPGTIVRRNFSFLPGEKSSCNRLYRQIIDRVLARRHRIVDFFFALTPLEPSDHWRRILSLARQFVVEVETHPTNSNEYGFLAGGEVWRRTGDLPIAPCFAAARREYSTGGHR